MSKTFRWNKVIIGIILIVLLIPAILLIREYWWYRDVECILRWPVETRTRTKLMGIFGYAWRYREEKGHLPKSENELVTQAMSDDIQTHLKTGFAKKINNKIYYLDEWKRPIKYVYVKNQDDESCLIYSYGQNGLDEKAKGDDVSYFEYVYWSDEASQFVIDSDAKSAGIPTDEYRKTHPWPKGLNKVNEPNNK
jgi:hypothetical protein